MHLVAVTFHGGSVYWYDDFFNANHESRPRLARTDGTGGCIMIHHSEIGSWGYPPVIISNALGCMGCMRRQRGFRDHPKEQRRHPTGDRISTKRNTISQEILQ